MAIIDIDKVVKDIDEAKEANETKKSEVKMSSPWVIYVKKLTALFENDPDLKLKYDENENKVTIFVETTEKYEALSKLLPTEKVFGNVKLLISLVPANAGVNGMDKGYLFSKAFENNPIFNEVITIPDVFSNSVTYVMFESDEIAQFFGDNMGDPHGNVSMLYQDIAKDVFEGIDGVFFSTEPKYY